VAMELSQLTGRRSDNQLGVPKFAQANRVSDAVATYQQSLEYPVFIRRPYTLKRHPQPRIPPRIARVRIARRAKQLLQCYRLYVQVLRSWHSDNSTVTTIKGLDCLTLFNYELINFHLLPTERRLKSRAV
jgi:hypothetical protein